MRNKTCMCCYKDAPRPCDATQHRLRVRRQPAMASLASPNIGCDALLRDGHGRTCNKLCASNLGGLVALAKTSRRKRGRGMLLPASARGTCVYHRPTADGIPIDTHRMAHLLAQHFDLKYAPGRKARCLRQWPKTRTSTHVPKPACHMKPEPLCTRKCARPSTPQPQRHALR